MTPSLGGGNVQRGHRLPFMIPSTTFLFDPALLRRMVPYLPILTAFPALMQDLAQLHSVGDDESAGGGSFFLIFARFLHLAELRPLSSKHVRPHVGLRIFGAHVLF